MNSNTLTGSLTDCRMISISNTDNNVNTSSNNSSNAGGNNNTMEKMDITNSGNMLSDMDNDNENGLIKIESRQPSPKRMNTSLPTSSSSSSSSTPSIAGMRDHHYHRTAHHRSTNDLSTALMDVKPSSYGSILDGNNEGKDGQVDIHGSDNASGNSGGQYFNETLDLSQEDIQQTLSANMPMSCSTPEPQHRFVCFFRLSISLFSERFVIAFL